MNSIKKIFIQNSFLKNVAKLLSANVFIQIIAFALSTIISRLYTPTDFSHLAVFMSIAGMFSIISTLGFEFSIILPKKNDSAKSIVKLSFYTSIIVVILSFIFIIAFKDNINKYYNIDLSTIWWFMLPLYVLFNASFKILINYFNRLKNYNKQALAQSILGISNPISAIIIGTKKILNFGLIYSVIISNIVSNLYLFPILIKDKIFESSINLKTTFKDYYKFPIFYTPQLLVNFISNNLPVFILTPAFGEITIGLITMAIGKVFKPINIIGSSIYQVLSKQIVDDITANKKVLKKVFRLLKSQFFIAIIPFLIVFIFSPRIFSIVWGEQWHQAGVYLQYLLPWLFMVYMNSTLTFIPNVFSEQKTSLVLEIIHLTLRFFALFYGVQKGDIYLSIGLYALEGFIMLFINLLWYISILKKHDSKINAK